ncbi:MAG: ABC transporter ATP-binding protein [Betaproteobacteria bacterium]|nr:ABC transporter ATP-binding protein [Betaproteobacteria bacterium]
MQLEFSNVNHYYGRRQAIGGLSFDLRQGEIGVLIGPSGAGKSTVLNCIAGLEPIVSGEIRIGGELASGTRVHVPAERRQVGMMFQDSALFPHLDVAGNICFGIAKRTDRSTRLAELLELCRLADYAGARVHELSGGQQQRVALARALAPRPKLLLLDEPFCSSDAALRSELLAEVRQIIKEEGSTALMVTHDQAEAFEFADRCGVLDSGTLCQWDSPYNLYHRPNCALVASFIGDGALIPGTLVSEHEVETELGVVSSDQRLTTLLMEAGHKVKVLMRPDDVVLANGCGGTRAQVFKRAFRGADILYGLRTGAGTELYACLPSRHDLAAGDAIEVSLQVEHVVVFPAVE